MLARPLLTAAARRQLPAFAISAVPSATAASFAKMRMSPVMQTTSIYAAPQILRVHHARTFSRNSSPEAPSGSERVANLGLVIVPQQKAYVIERFGRFNRVLTPGLHILIPLVDRISYVHTLKETPIPIPGQTAITQDNVTISMDGVLYVRIVDPVKASYGVERLYYSISALAQTTMRAEIGKMSLDKTLSERDHLNQTIVLALNKAAEAWGVQCLRYEIRDIIPPDSVKHAMDRQAQAERTKRATILDSEGTRQADINVAEGQRQAVVLAANAEAEATLARATATSKAINMVAEAIKKEGGTDAVALRVAEQYIHAFGNIAQKSTTMLLPSQVGDPVSMAATAMEMYKSIVGKAKDKQEGAATSYSLRDAMDKEDAATRQASKKTE